MKSFIYLNVILATFFIFTSAFASEPSLAPSPALACLTRASGSLEKIDYPQELLERKEGDTISVELVFHGPEDAPEVKINQKNSYRDLVDVVEEYVKGYRVPCMNKNDAAVSLRQDYVFSPNDGRKVMHSSPEDEADMDRKNQLKCMLNVDSMTKPNYPQSALGKKLEGNFFVKVRFDAPDKPPVVDWLAYYELNSLYVSVQNYLNGLRLPCMKDGPVSFTRFYTFKIDGNSTTFLKDMSLKDFLVAAKDLQRPAYFDLNTMTCPFDLRVQYIQPYSKNEILELESTNPNRKVLIDWLSSVTLNLNKRDSIKVLGNIFTLRVPCGKIDL